MNKNRKPNAELIRAQEGAAAILYGAMKDLTETYGDLLAQSESPHERFGIITNQYIPALETAVRLLSELLRAPKE